MTMMTTTKKKHDDDGDGDGGGDDDDDDWPQTGMKILIVRRVPKRCLRPRSKATLLSAFQSEGLTLSTSFNSSPEEVRY